MIADHLRDIEKFEADLWKIADNLRANSNLASNEYFMPIMGLIFLRHATNRFYAAKAAIETDQAAGKMPRRALIDADFTRRRALNLPESARFDVILKTPKDGNLGAALTSAMEAIEAAFPPLANQLPKDYGRFSASTPTCRPRRSTTRCGRSGAASRPWCYSTACWRMTGCSTLSKISSCSTRASPAPRAR